MVKKLKTSFFLKHFIIGVINYLINVKFLIRLGQKKANIFISKPFICDPSTS